MLGSNARINRHVLNCPLEGLIRHFLELRTGDGSAILSYAEFVGDYSGCFRMVARYHVQIQQDAGEFYPSMTRDIESARHSIHLQYFIWGADPFTERLKEILSAKAKTGVEVRLLYDPLGSQAHAVDVGRAGRRPPARLHYGKRATTPRKDRRSLG